jgi:S-adenosylmethionine synthetase
MIIKTFKLKRPIFKKTSSGGHFGRQEFEWEQIVDLSHERIQ